MKTSLIGFLFLAVASLTVWAQEGMPRMNSVDPASGKRGDVITVNGENLDKAHVSKVYLTNGKTDLECVITEQNATAIKIKVPDKATGRMAVMILTSGKEASLIEQPVKLTVEQ
jgi:hypothetical protein